MNTLKLFAAAGAAALAFGMVGAASAATIADQSFEAPVTGGFDYNPTVDGVTFTGDAGVARGTGFDPTPYGDQNAFLQSTDTSGAEIDIDVTGLAIGGVYTFSFFDDQRSGFGVNPYDVSFNGASLGHFSPSEIGWLSRTTHSFVASATDGVLTFAAPLRGYDNDVGIDNITVSGGLASGAPEPAAWALMLMGFGGMGALLRRRQRALSPTL